MKGHNIKVNLYSSTSCRTIWHLTLFFNYLLFARILCSRKYSTNWSQNWYKPAQVKQHNATQKNNFHTVALADAASSEERSEKQTFQKLSGPINFSIRQKRGTHWSNLFSLLLTRIKFSKKEAVTFPRRTESNGISPPCNRLRSI